MNNGILYWDIDPVIFWITDTLPFKYYGFLFVIGLVLGYVFVRRLYIKDSIPIDNLEKLIIYVFIGTILGARLGHCLFYSPVYYLQNPLEILLPIKKFGDSYQFIGFQGLASHGGTIGVLAAISIYCKKYKMRFLQTVDRITIGAAIAATFIRFGNFMNSEIYGKPTNGKWGVVFQQDDLIPRHPTQLYEALSYLLIFIILSIIDRNRKSPKPEGMIFGLFLVLLFSARFIIEFFKENQVGFESGMMINMGQILSIPFIIIGLVLMNRKSSNGGNRNTPSSQINQ